MTSEIIFETFANKDEWNRFVELNGGSIFQLYEWPEILHKTYGYKPLYFCVRESGEMKAAMPAIITKNPFRRSLVSIPFTDYAGPLGEEKACMQLMEFVLKYCAEQGLNVVIYSLDKLPKLHAYHFVDTFWLDTRRSFDSIWMENFSKKVRNSVRKATKSGVVIERETSRSFLKEYYKIYIETMRRLSALPHHLSFFTNIADLLGEKFQMFAARYNGELIAGLLTFSFNKRVHIWSNASQKEYLHLAPNNALYSEIIKRACDADVDIVDFGTSVPETSHYWFKAAWGGTAKPVYTCSNTVQKLSKPPRWLKIVPKHFLVPLTRFVFKWFY